MLPSKLLHLKQRILAQTFAPQMAATEGKRGKVPAPKHTTESQLLLAQSLITAQLSAKTTKSMTILKHLCNFSVARALEQIQPHVTFPQIFCKALHSATEEVCICKHSVNSFTRYLFSLYLQFLFGPWTADHLVSSNRAVKQFCPHTLPIPSTVHSVSFCFSSRESSSY